MQHKIYINVQMNVEGDEQPTVSEADCFLQVLEMVKFDFHLWELLCCNTGRHAIRYHIITEMDATNSKQAVCNAFNNERGAVHRTANRCVVFEESFVGLYEFLSEEALANNLIRGDCVLTSYLGVKDIYQIIKYLNRKVDANTFPHFH